MPIAMTFDDGPSSRTTPRLLDLLDELNIQVTFFVLGRMVTANRALLQRMASSPQQHEICNHSWSHPHFTELTNTQIREEIERTQRVIEDAAGNRSPSRIFRPPYGHIREDQKRFISQELGYRLIGWNVDSNDYLEREPGRVTHNIMTQIRDRQVILAHDIHDHTIQAMPATFRALTQRGFTFQSVSRLGNFTHGGFEDTTRRRSGRTPIAPH